MTDLENLDQRAHRAAADVRSRAAARPRPAFDPSDATLLPVPARLDDRRPRRSLLAAAAVVLLVLIGGLAFVARHQGDDDKGPADTITTTEPPRPFVATDLPRGMALGGVVDPTTKGAGPPEFTPLRIYGPAIDRPELGVGLLLDESNTFADMKKVEVDGRTVLTADDAGLGKRVVIVPRGKQAVFAMSPVLDRAALADAAEGAKVDGKEVQMAADTLPDGFHLLTEEPDPAGPVGVGVLRGGPVPGSVAAYLRGTAVGATAAGSGSRAPVVDDSALVTVTSTAGDEARMEAVRLWADAVAVTSIRGHRALLTTTAVPRPTGGDLVVRVLTWMERPGDLLRVSGLGVSSGELAKTAEGIRPVPAKEWADLLERTKLGEFSAASDTPAATELGRGRFADGTAWALLGRHENDSSSSSMALELNVAIDGNSDTSQSMSASGQSIGAPDGQPVGVFTQTLVQHRGGRNFAAGLLRSDVASLDLLDGQGRPAGVVTLLTVKGAPAFVAELSADPAVVVARAADGRELDRVTLSNAGGNQSPPISEGPTPGTVTSGSPQVSGGTAGSKQPAPGQSDSAPPPLLPGN